MAPPQEYNWLYVAKRKGKPEFIKAFPFKQFNPEAAEWTTDVNEAAEWTEAEWERIRAAEDFIISEDCVLVSFADEPREPGERPTGRHGHRR